MNKKAVQIKFFAYPLILIVIVFAIFEYANITIVNAATCCKYGVDCPEGQGRVPILKCCFPWQEAPCSVAKPNYCRESC